MLSRNELKYIQSLSHKKQRQEDNLFIAEGPKIIGELLQSNFTVRKVYATAGWNMPETATNIEFAEISTIELERISALQTPHQVMAITEQKIPDAEPVLKGRISLVLDGIQDPGNFGTIIRIADWFGISQVICSEDTVELYNPKVIQSTMGSFIRVNVWYKNIEAFLTDAGVPVFGALLTGTTIHQISKPQEALLVIGNEAKGIRENILPFIKHPVTIPRIGMAESLNAAVATGIILSHFQQ